MPNHYVEDIAETVGCRYPEKVLEWADTLQAETRGQAVDAALADYAEEDPQAAATLLATRFPDDMSAASDAEFKAFKSIAQSWADIDPQQAGEWADNLPESKARLLAVEALADEWTAADPVGVSTWVANLPPGLARDVAAFELIEHVMRDDPSGALQRATSLSRQRDIDRYTTRVFQTWLRTDPNGAQAALSYGNVSQTVAA